MAYDEGLAQRVRVALRRRQGFAEKKMFGGVGFLLRGNMCVGVWKEWLIVRLGPDMGESALREPHVRPFDITGRAMRGWAMIAPEGVEDDNELKRWIRAAAEFVAELPAKHA